MALLLLASCATPSLETRAESQAGHFIRMPDEPSPPKAPEDAGVLSITTNLPDGIIVFVEHRNIEPETSFGGQCCPAFADGSLDHVIRNNCSMPPETASRKFTITVIAAPHPQQGQHCGPGDCNQMKQPDNVYEALGPEFEKLDGEQVTTYNGMRALVATATYEWPANACEHAINTYLAPDTCAPSTASIDDDEGGANLRRVAGTPIATLGQMRLCELYNYATAKFRDENPWREWRDRTRAWIESHRPLAKPGLEWYMTWEITGKSSKTLGHEFDSPEWIDVDYFLRGQRVGHAHYVARIWYSGYTKWEMARLVLN